MIQQPKIAQFRSPHELRPHPDNPRGAIQPDDPAIVELAASIAEEGIYNPLVITPEGVILAGHRRHAAALLAGCPLVPVDVRVVCRADELVIMLAENIQRQELTPLQQAETAGKLTAEGLDVPTIAARIGRSAVYVYRLIKLLDLPADVRDMIRAGRLSAAQGSALVRFVGTDAFRRVLHEASHNGMSAAMIDTLDDQGLRPAAKTPITGFAPAPGSYAAALRDDGTVPASYGQMPAQRQRPAMARLRPDDPATIAAGLAGVGGDEAEIRDAERVLAAEYIRDSLVSRAPCRECRAFLLTVAAEIEAGRHVGAE